VDIKLQYNEIGRKYVAGQKSFFGPREYWSQQMADRILGTLEKKKVLDVGCGGGSDVAHFESRGANVFGVDPSSEMASTKICHFRIRRLISCLGVFHYTISRHLTGPIRKFTAC
jgi:2-polyprenyl-3-methyl-5-hydroxy-6-metoxy-1,4-benzoquinol methylase